MQNIHSIGIVGAGQMGRGIAQVAAMSGYQVKIFDVSSEGLKKGVDFIQAQLEKGAEKGKWDSNSVKTSLNNIVAVTEIGKLSNCDLLIEAAISSIGEILFRVLFTVSASHFPFSAPLSS